MPISAVLAAVAVLVLAAGGWLLRDKFFGPRSSTGGGGASKPVSLAILPFRNASGDASIDWLGKIVADMVRTELGEAPGLRIVPSGRISEILGDLRVQPNANVDEGTLVRVSRFASAEFLVAGQYSRVGNAIRLEASLRNTDGTTRPLTAEAASDGDIPVAVKTLVQSLRENVSAAPATAG